MKSIVCCDVQIYTRGRTQVCVLVINEPYGVMYMYECPFLAIIVVQKALFSVREAKKKGQEARIKKNFGGRGALPYYYYCKLHTVR